MASSPACRPFFSGASSPTASAVAPLATSPLASAHDALPPPSLDLSSDAVASALALFHEMKKAGDLVLACVVVRIQSCPRSPLWCPSAPPEQDLLPAMSAQVALQIDDLFERSLQGGSQVCKSICLMFNAHLAGAKESPRMSIPPLPLQVQVLLDLPRLGGRRVPCVLACLGRRQRLPPCPRRRRPLSPQLPPSWFYQTLSMKETMTSPPLNGPEFIDAPMRKSKLTASLKSHDATSSQKCFMARLQAMSCIVRIGRKSYMHG